jgi:hypothetical protein
MSKLDFMSVEIIESDGCCMKVHDDGLLEYTIKEGVEMDTEFILNIKETLEALRPGQKYYCLSDSVGFFNITYEARELSATEEFSSHLAAVAFFTSNYSLQLMGDVYNKINKPVVETKIFADRDSALEWLREQMEPKHAGSHHVV